MRRALVPVLALALLLGPARGEDEHSIDQHVLSDGSAAGDWCVLETTVSFDSPVEAKTALPERILVTYVVKSVSHEEVELAGETDPSHEAQWQTRKIPRGAVDLEDLLGLGPGVKVSEFRKTNETRRIGDKDLECVRLSFTTTENGIEQQNEAWYCHDMRSLRLAAFSSRVLTGAQPRVSVDMEVRGWGTRKETAWGKRREELLK